MGDSFIRNMLQRQRQRITAIVLGHAERTFYDRLSPEEQREFRRVVLAGISTYHQACIDMIESSVDTGLMANQEALRAIAEFNENVQAHRDVLQGLSGGLSEVGSGVHSG